MTASLAPVPAAPDDLAGLATEPELARLTEAARRIRVETFRTVYASGVGHLGGSLSEADILAALYFGVLRIRPAEPEWPDRDRFVLSKGHASVGLYATLALRGYFLLDELPTFDSAGSRLQGHPDMTRLPGLDMSTGSLGMGISAAVGIALGLRLQGRDARTYVLVGDGECQEGEVWEAAFVAARYELDRLVAIVDHNRLQQYGWQGADHEDRLPPEAPGELVAKWAAFGWRVLDIDGHDMAAIVGALATAAEGDGRPTVIVANTVKGRGLSFAEDRYLWHTRIPNAEEYARGLVELGEPASEGEAAR
ncbi:MAG TPA: transketolase [Candidatus Limnocylindrales bacterium]